MVIAGVATSICSDVPQGDIPRFIASQQRGKLPV
jgi:hypothetical protein